MLNAFCPPLGLLSSQYIILRHAQLKPHVDGLLQRVAALGEVLLRNPHDRGGNIIPASPGVLADGWTLSSQRPDRARRLTARSSFAVMIHEHMPRACTSDHHLLPHITLTLGYGFRCHRLYEKVYQGRQADSRASGHVVMRILWKFYSDPNGAS